MSKNVAIANQKGGVGKTFIAANLSVQLASKGNKVLMVELDPQSNLVRSFFDVPDDASPDFLTTQGMAHTLELFEEDFVGSPVQVRENLYLFGGDKKLSVVEKFGSELKDFFKYNINLLNDQFDFIVFDCPPSIGELQSSALAVATHLIVPSEASSASLQGASSIFTTAKSTRKRSNHQLQITGVLLNKLKRPSSNVQDVFVEEIREKFGALVFDTEIFSTVKVEESVASLEPIVEYSPQHAKKIGMDTFYSEFIKRTEA